MAAAKKAPWAKRNPKSAARRTKLTADQKAKAKRRAAKAGRTYPNLIDNMAVSRKGSKLLTRAKTARAGAKATREDGR